MGDTRDTVVVTGASSGIGRAVAQQLIDEGYSVVGIGRDARRMNIENLRFRAFECDLADLDALPQRLAKFNETLTTLKAVVLCAGVGRFGCLEEFSYAQIRALVDTNVSSQIFLVRALLPALKIRKRGDVVVIGSEASLAGGRRGTVYSATKFALRGFTQALRQELAANGVRVCLVNPGMVRTEFFDTLDFAPGDDPANYLRPEDVATAVSSVLHMPPGTVVDEINLSPLKKVIRRKSVGDSIADPNSSAGR